MSEPSLDSIVPEQEFVTLLTGEAAPFAAIASRIMTSPAERWPKRYYFRLQIEADELEVLLDDYGARHNRTFCVLRELTASIRGFAQSGLSLTHLAKRLDGYGILGSLAEDEAAACKRSVERGRAYVQGTLHKLLEAWGKEAKARGLEWSIQGVEESLPIESVRFRLPRNLNQGELTEETQRIAEVASKYLQACQDLNEVGLSAETDAVSRDRLLELKCDETIARTLEATCHNLQSAYDTHIANSNLEASDNRLRQLRGHITVALHLLESVTHLTHFVERHDTDQHSDIVENFLSTIVDRHEVQNVVLHDLFLPAQRLLMAGSGLAQELLPTYSDLQSVELELPEGVSLHARPVSLLVAIASHHGTPVEIAVGEESANAASILEVMVLAGSNAEERVFTFRGDSRPLGDIRALFEAGLGEHGLEDLPESLEYLRR